MISLKIEPSISREERNTSTLSEIQRGTVCLNFTLNRQARSNWCWASIAEACEKYLFGKVVTQNDLAYKFQSYKKKSALPNSEESNRQESLEKVLTFLSCYSHWNPGRPNLERIDQEIRSYKPIFLSLDWKNSGSHFVALTGCSLERNEIRIDDPLHGSSWQNFDLFPQTYRSEGTVWRNTYWVSESLLPKYQ
ncbi:hypothetical protein EHQ52_01555 [Leptospira koniambonensis]|uniref:Peptidase C39-like domain-containing protein n=1 Tax=Leptospira koniambonensis TaxID=2484950 RepID=A0A4R9JC52_9LEPT|nr:papain-like cysteine protease family protein [Leptospira koniambonensis]TGL36589.1 hypothetical protein EHQ52_01555 [Leptospira koniambonensis]